MTSAQVSISVKFNITDVSPYLADDMIVQSDSINFFFGLKVCHAPFETLQAPSSTELPFLEG